MGQILQVNVSRGGIPKRPVSHGTLTSAGFDGDSCAHPQYHGGPQKAVLLVASEVLEDLIAAGFPVFWGALGENLTTRSVDPASLRLGQRWRVGSALIELTKVRVPCKTLKIYGAQIGDAIFDARTKRGDYTSPVWCRSGVYARVIRPGMVSPGDAMQLDSEIT